MLQVLKGATLLLGIALLSCVGLIAATRSNTPLQSWLLAGPDPNGTYATHYLYWWVLQQGDTVHLRAKTAIEGEVVRWSGKDLYLLQYEFNGQYPDGTYHLIHATWNTPPRRIETLSMSRESDFFTKLLWSADGAWLVYEKDGDLWRRRGNGTQPLNLTRGRYGIIELAGRRSAMFSTDNQWIYFDGAKANRVSHIFRARLADGKIEDMTPAATQSNTLAYALPDAAGMIVEEYTPSGPIYWYVAEDSRQRWQLTTEGRSWTWITDYLPEQQHLLVLSRDMQSLQLIRLADGVELWSVPFAFVTISPDQLWLYMERFQADGPPSAIMRWDATASNAQIDTLMEDYGEIWGWALDADGAWLFFVNRANPPVGPYLLHRISADGQTLEIVATFDSYPDFVGWTPQDNRLIFSLFEIPSQIAQPMQMHPDGSGLGPIFPIQPSEYVNRVIFGPTIDLEWQPAHLIFSGVALLTLSFGVGRWRRKSKTAVRQ